jgi:hypothetical protein
VDVVGRVGGRGTGRWLAGGGRRTGRRLRWRSAPGHRGRCRAHADTRCGGHEGGRRGRCLRLRRGRDAGGCGGPTRVLPQSIGGRRTEHADDEGQGQSRRCEARPWRPTPIDPPQIRSPPPAGQVCIRSRTGRQLARGVVGRRGMPAAISGLPPPGWRCAPVPPTTGVHPPVGVCSAHGRASQPSRRAGPPARLPGVNATDSDGRHR